MMVDAMGSFDPTAAALGWLDAYRAADLNEIIDLYSDDAALECWCDKQVMLGGRAAITAYWRHRLADTPAGELEDVQPNGSAVVVRYRASSRVLETRLKFNDAGKIERSRCGPPVDIRAFRPRAHVG
jgi:hypothetical protein